MKVLFQRHDYLVRVDKATFNCRHLKCLRWCTMLIKLWMWNQPRKLIFNLFTKTLMTCTVKQCNHNICLALQNSGRLSMQSSLVDTHILCLMGKQSSVTNRSWASSQGSGGHVSHREKGSSPGIILWGGLREILKDNTDIPKWSWSLGQ